MSANTGLPRLDARVVLHGRAADTIRAMALMEATTQAEIMRRLLTMAIEDPQRRPDLTRVRTEALIDADRTPIQIAEQLGVTVQYVRNVRRQMKRKREQQS